MDDVYDYRAPDGSECRIIVERNQEPVYQAVVIWWPAGIQDFPDRYPASVDTLPIELERAKKCVERLGFRPVCPHCGNVLTKETK